MKPITTKFERNQYLRTKSTLYQIGWLDAETRVDLDTELHRRGYDYIASIFSNDEYCLGLHDHDNHFSATILPRWYSYVDMLPPFPFLPSCLNTTFLAMEGPIKDYGFTTEWKSLAIADGTIFMFDYGGTNLADCFGPDYRIDLEIEGFHSSDDAATYQGKEGNPNHDYKKKY